MAASADVGSVVVDELKKQARAEGFFVLALHERDVWIIAVAAVYFLLGVSWGSRQ
jgi:hypothetical protein